MHYRLGAIKYNQNQTKREQDKLNKDLYLATLRYVMVDLSLEERSRALLDSVPNKPFFDFSNQKFMIDSEQIGRDRRDAMQSFDGSYKDFIIRQQCNIGHSKAQGLK